MKETTKIENVKRIEWHPAFQASIQIEFEAESEKLTFEPEHLLSKKPMQIDELIIKVKDNETIEKNIGRIFRKYNIIEYKSPDDYLTINDFYKVYGYSCFYQADTEKVMEISPQDLSITFICNHYPRAMVQHLQRYRKLEVKKKEAGIYYITGDEIPMQLLITRELNPEENLWLQSLRKDIKGEEEIENLLKVYEGKKYSKLYQAAMDVITRANWTAMMEVKGNMCEALRELMEDEFKEFEQQVTEQVTGEVTTQMIKNAYESIKDKNAISKILKVPVDVVERVLQDEKEEE